MKKVYLFSKIDGQKAPEAKASVNKEEIKQNQEKMDKKNLDMPDFKNVDDKDGEINQKPRMDKYKERQEKDKYIPSEHESKKSVEEIRDHHQKKILLYTNSNRSPPNDTYFDYNKNQDNIDEILDGFEGDEGNKENKNKIVEQLENIDDDIILVHDGTIQEEGVNKNLGK